MMDRVLPLALALAAFPAAFAQSSCTLPALSSRIPMPSMASGYAARLVATGLSRPRGIIIDQQDRLLVVEQRQRVVAITLNDNGGNCLSVNTTTEVVNDDTVGHTVSLQFVEGLLIILAESWY
jgi:glucose/arabinose dehydrogenase